jgi:hypothetical protein
MNAKLRPIANPDNPPRGSLERALRWFETRCRLRGIDEVTEADVRNFLREEFPLAESKFRPTHLIPVQPDELL